MPVLATRSEEIAQKCEAGSSLESPPSRSGHASPLIATTSVTLKPLVVLPRQTASSRALDQLAIGGQEMYWLDRVGPDTAVMAQPTSGANRAGLHGPG